MANQTVRNIRLIEDYRDKILFYRLFFSHIMMADAQYCIAQHTNKIFGNSNKIIVY